MAIPSRSFLPHGCTQASAPTCGLLALIPLIRRPSEEERAKALAVEHITQLLGAVDDNAPAIVLTDIIDKFGGRVVAQVQTANGVNLGQSLLNAGLAQPYDGGTKPFGALGPGSAPRQMGNAAPQPVNKVKKQAAVDVT